MANKECDLLYDVRKSFWTKREFNEKLIQYSENNGLDSVYFEVEKVFNNERRISFNYSYGKKLEQSEKRKQYYINNEQSVVINCSIWSKGIIPLQVEMELMDIIRMYISSENTDTTLLPVYEQGMRNKCELTVKRYLESGKKVALFMIDLDKFKIVNETYGHEIGTSVIFEFANILLQHWENEAIVIHRSGDEFFIITPYENLILPFKTAYEVSKKVIEHNFTGTEQIWLTAAQGICLVSDTDISFKDIAVMAERAYKYENTNKHRDSIRVYTPDDDTLSKRNESNYDLEFVNVRSGLDRQCIFNNPYLDFISYIASCCETVDDIKDNIESAISWIKPVIVKGTTMRAFQQYFNYKCEWSYEELAFSLLHGLSRNTLLCGKRIELIFDTSDENCFKILANSDLLYIQGEKTNDSSSRVYSIKLPDNAIYKYGIRSTILINIGYEIPPMSECFFDVIKIDARPTIGGNLPDFWAPALSELFELVSRNGFIQNVIVYGKKEYAQRICDILENISNWDSGKYKTLFLSQKTEQPIPVISKCRDKLIDNIYFIDKGNIKEIIDRLKIIYSKCAWVTNNCEIYDYEERRYLDRRISYEPLQLQIEDGCIVNTFDEAYPTVLEIIRRYETNENLETMIDQAGREFKELNNFKITIRKPSSKYVPVYYKQESDELDNYYKSVFGSEDAFFLKPLNEGGQYKAVINHVAKLINGDKLKYATRRALMVVPHKIENPDDVSPLGLVSIYISPRQTNDSIVFDFSYTWRTVEAVLGLPFSLYGSIRFSEQLLEEIRKLSEQEKSEILQMGSVSYNAYSLHMYLDNYYSKIVRGIINDATK